MLRADDVVAGYVRDEPVLDGLTFAVESGQTVGVLGPSGCGKSTLLRVLSLLHRPWSGQVSVDGEVVGGYRYAAPPALRRTVGLVFQQPRSAVDPRFTLRRIVAEYAADGADEVEDLYELVGLSAELLDRRPHEVSEGQLQRVCLARALAVRPRYLLCDEITAMLDASTTAALVSAVQRYATERDVGVVAVSHDETLLSAWADDVRRWPLLV